MDLPVGRVALAAPKDFPYQPRWQSNTLKPCGIALNLGLTHRLSALGANVVYQSRGIWTSETVSGHTCDVYQLPSPNENGYVVLYLHGVHLGKLREQPAFMQQIDKHALSVVSPLTGPSWWTDRICPQFDSKITAHAYILDDVLPFIERRFGCGPPRIGLLGTSMGGQGALRLAYKLPDVFPVVAAISPAIDYQTRIVEGDEVLAQMYEDPEAARQDTATLHIHPLNWPRHQFFCCDPTDSRWFDSADRLRMKLSSLGVPFECDLETVGGGHEIAYYHLMAERAVDFLFQRLERERLRIV